jgi:hypothetical protein
VVFSEKSQKFRPKTDAEKDAEYDILSVSSDGLVTRNKRVKGEDFKEMRKVQAGDIAYNPMRVNIGSIGVVPRALDNGLVSPDYVVFRSNDLDPDFLVTLLRSPFYRMYIDVMTTGSIRDRLYFNNLQAIRVPDVSTIEQAVICARGHKADEIHESLRESAVERSKSIDKLNSIIRAPSLETGDLTESFPALAERWRRETGMLSSATKKVKHPAYLKIIELGSPAIPLILREMQSTPGHWFEALKTITGESPIPANERADMKRATEAWLKWGKERGYLG